MSAICQNFVQNAWKKELCSNCFKSKDEHVLAEVKTFPVNNNDKKATSIIKNGNKIKSKTKKRAVSFKNEISKVIGYGGEDWSEEEPDLVYNDDDAYDEIDQCVDGDEERELQRLTKHNTDFNTVNANLLSPNNNNEVKKSYTHLKLGTPQISSDGKKQTLLVSVTPFGQDSMSVKKNQKPASHIPVAKNKDSLVENKTSAILTSYTSKNEENIFIEEKSLLDEISETLEKNKTPIQFISLKRTHKDIHLSINKTDSVDKNKENENVPSNKNSSTYLLEKAAERSTEKIKDLKLNKLNISDRKNGITRAPVIKRDQEKPVFQTSTAKIELLNNKNFKLNRETLTQNDNTKSDITNNVEKFNNCNAEAKKTNDVEKGVRENDNSNNKTSLKIEKESSDEAISTDCECSEDSSIESGNSLTESSAGERLTSNQHESIQNLDTTPSQTREQAGEPDGDSSPDYENDPPALPATSPPFIETRTSFLHGNDTPKPASKPAAVPIRKASNTAETEPRQPTMTSFASEARLEIKSVAMEKNKIEKPEPSGFDSMRVGNKRKAPKPPKLNENLFLHNSTTDLESALSKEKRASSCSPKIRNQVCSQPNGLPLISPVVLPKKSFSLSTDNLTATVSEEKKKEKSKGRFSLKRFLRINSSKDLNKISTDPPKYEEVKFEDSQIKPKLVIVHPLELNGAQVEVLTKPQLTPEPNQYKVSQSISSESINHDRSAKPPPPPRNFQEWNNRNKPNLPHPPKSVEVVNKQKHFIKMNYFKNKNDSVYANIGEVRSAIVPNKPQRTASMREREAQEQNCHSSGAYEPINISNGRPKENVYDYINLARCSSPEYDNSSSDNISPTPKNNKIMKILRQGRSNSQMDVSGEYFKFQNIPRSASLTYCGSETESEIYSPHSFCGSECEVADEDHDWSTPNGRTHKLRSRKGRSIVHKNLEDNYGAVIIANHEALAQVLENIQQGPPIQPALRGLKTAPNLRWADFSVKENLPSMVIGHRIFHQAVWGAHHVTLVINTSSTPTCSLSLGTFNLVPITEFTDLVPAKYVITDNEMESLNPIQSSIAVYPWMQINTIQTYTELLKNKSITSTPEEIYKDACFIILQLVNALKMLQAQGIEELPLGLTSFVICREIEKDTHFRLCVLQGLGEEITQKKENVKFGSLCLCTTTVLGHLLPNFKLTPLIRSLLNTERAVSLSQVKSILEFSLWGPSDVILSPSLKDRELTLQRWLDLQRATVLHGLVCARIHLNVYEECHLLFLVRSNAKMMCDASLLLESSSKQNMVVNGRK